MKKTALQSIARAIMPHIISIETSDDGILNVIYITSIKGLNVIQNVLLPIEDFESASEEYTNYLLEHAELQLVGDNIISQALGDQYNS